MEIKGLYDALGISQSEVDALRTLQVDSAVQRVMFYSRIVSAGGNIHRVNREATAKRRAKNKVARKSRHVNAHN